MRMKGKTLKTDNLLPHRIRGLLPYIGSGLVHALGMGAVALSLPSQTWDSSQEGLLPLPLFFSEPPSPSPDRSEDDGSEVSPTKALESKASPQQKNDPLPQDPLPSASNLKQKKPSLERARSHRQNLDQADAPSKQKRTAQQKVFQQRSLLGAKETREDGVLRPEGVTPTPCAGGASPLYAPSPPYPREARRHKWTGEVLMRLQVSPGGQVLTAKVVTSAPHAVLNHAAQEGLQAWRFPEIPASCGERFYKVPISFALK